MGLLASAHENGGTGRGFGSSNRATLAGKSWMHFLMLDDGLTMDTLTIDIYYMARSWGRFFFLFRLEI